MSWLKQMFTRSRRYDELSESIREHLDEKIADLMDRGMTREQAESVARREFGNVTRIEERSREVWQWPKLESVLADIKFAFRQLRKSPGFAITAILTLALGIGATTAVFSLVNSVVLQPLAFRDSGQLVAINEIVQEFVKQFPLVPTNARQFQYWSEQARSFSEMTLLRFKAQTLIMPHAQPQLIESVQAMPNLFSLLGVSPILGRGFLSEEGTEGHDSVVVITNALWRREFHADQLIVGQQISLDGHLFTIVGVLPATFSFPAIHSPVTMAGDAPKNAEMFTPLVLNFNDSPVMGSFNFIALGRLKPGISISHAQVELTGLLQAFTVAQIKSPIHLSAHVELLQQNVVGSSGRALWLLLAAVLSVLLIACVNLTNLQLARAVARDRDAAVRAALGASRLRLAQVAISESAILSFIGGVIGIVLAFVAVRLFVHDLPSTIPRLKDVHVDLTVLTVALLMTAGTAVVSGLMPSLRSFRAEPLEALKSNSSRSGNTRGMVRMRRLLVAAEVAGTTVLLILCALTLHSFANALHTPRGFNASHVTIAEVDLFKQSHEQRNDRVTFDREVLRRLDALPGVETASVTQVMPLAGDQSVTDVQRADSPLVPTQAPLMNFRYIGEQYFSTLGIPIVDGRALAPEDQDKNRVVLSDKAARILWPSESAIGRQIVMNDGGPKNTYTVVGVVGDVRTQHLTAASSPTVYLPFTDNPPYATYFLIRSSKAIGGLTGTLRQQIWQVDPQVAIPTIKSLDDQIGDSLSAERLEALMLGGFASAAIILAILGVYGVLAYSVTSGTRDIGLRIAFGADRASIYRMVCGQAVIPVVAGFGAGAVAATGIAHVVRSLLYGVGALDPLAMLSAFALIFLASSVAALLPARRAARIDPLQALRSE